MNREENQKANSPLSDMKETSPDEHETVKIGQRQGGIDKNGQKEKDVHGSE